MSEWPLRYFVRCGATRSKPASIGRKFTGLANVLSMSETSPCALAKRDDACEVGHLEQRVRHRLDVDGLRVRPQLRLPRGRIVRVDEVVGDAEVREVVRDEIVRAAVQAALRQQVIAGRQHREQRGRDRGHAAGGDQRGLGTFERGELGVRAPSWLGVLLSRM